MSLSIRPLTPSGFAGEVSGIDLTQPLSREQVATIDAGMDRFGVLVFHDQHFDDATQMAFSRYFGPLEVSSGAEMSKSEDRRLPQMEMADISNLDRAGNLRTASDRMPLTALGNQQSRVTMYLTGGLKQEVRSGNAGPWVDRAG